MGRCGAVTYRSRRSLDNLHSSISPLQLITNSDKKHPKAATYKNKTLPHYTLLQEIFEKDLAKGGFAEGTIGTAKVVYSIDR